MKAYKIELLNLDYLGLNKPKKKNRRNFTSIPIDIMWRNGLCNLSMSTRAFYVSIVLLYSEQMEDRFYINKKNTYIRNNVCILETVESILRCYVDRRSMILKQLNILEENRLIVVLNRPQIDCDKNTKHNKNTFNVQKEVISNESI